MQKKQYHVIGMMSGTSLDGVDLVEVIFTKEDRWRFEIGVSESKSYEDVWKRKLQTAMSLDEVALLQLDKEYTHYLGGRILTFIQSHNLKGIDAVCVHGHTIFHQPERGYTYQIGNRPELARLLGQRVVCDFRVPDVALGGQGAPLVPVGDALLFSDFDYCLNLGGFANISFDEGGKRKAWDVCAVNTLLNHYSEKLGMPYDDRGMVARSSRLNESLLQELNTLPFFSQKGPKSLGAEWVEGIVIPLIDRNETDPKVVLRTCVEHVAMQLANVFPKHKRVLTTGGGAFNSFLLERTEVLSDARLEVPDEALVSFKEAVIFAFLGVLRLREEVNCLSSVTGASRDHSSGYIYEAAV